MKTMIWIIVTAMTGSISAFTWQASRSSSYIRSSAIMSTTEDKSGE